MACLHTGILHFAACILLFLLIRADCTLSTDSNFSPPINRTAFQGETVVLHCNGSRDHLDIVWWKDGNRLFIHSPIRNQTETNYTSNRMQVDPRNSSKLQISNVQHSDTGEYSCSQPRTQWLLTITGNSGDQIRCIVSNVIGAVAVCLFIICVVFIYRKWKRKLSSENNREEHREESGINQSQYYERINSVYGRFQS